MREGALASQDLDLVVFSGEVCEKFRRLGGDKSDELGSDWYRGPGQKMLGFGLLTISGFVKAVLGIAVRGEDGDFVTTIL